MGRGFESLTAHQCENVANVKMLPIPMLPFFQLVLGIGIGNIFTLATISNFIASVKNVWSIQQMFGKNVVAPR